MSFRASASEESEAFLTTVQTKHCVRNKMWTKRSTLALIEDIRLNPCLWDTQCEDFKSRAKKVETFRVLGVKYGIHGKEVEQKFQALKNQFRREHRRLEKDEEGLSPKQIHWFGYEHLTFLLNNCVKPSQQSFSSERELEENEDTYQNTDTEYQEYVNYEVLETDTEPTNLSQEPRQIFTAVNKKSNANGTTTATEAFKCMRTLAEKICSRDEFDIYGEYIAYKLRECGRSSKEISIAQHEINTICFKLCMGEFAQNFEHSLQGSVHSNPETEQEEELRYVQYVDSDLKTDGK